MGMGLATLGDAWAQGAPTEGREFTRVDPPVPVSPEAGKRVDVVEFFSYACPHCNALEPTLEPWARALPADVYFHRIPVPFLFNHDYFQRLYYALEAMNSVDAVQQKVFNAVHLEHLRLEKPDEIFALMARNGIDAAKFKAVFDSFSVQAKARQATQLVAAWKVDSVPMVGVQGRFLTSPAQAGGGPQTLRVVDALVQRVRSGK